MTPYMPNYYKRSRYYGGYIAAGQSGPAEFPNIAVKEDSTMSYELVDKTAVITFDDGKANAVGHAFLDLINECLDKAESDKASAVVLKGREGLFSAGFDLGEFKKGAEAGMSMVSRGIELLIRLYSFPLPVVVACTGHGIAMGAFIILACDTRIGTRGSFKVTLPETAISMDVPLPMLALTQARMPLNYQTRALVQAEVFTPDQAVAAGFLDEVVEADELDARAMTVATALSQLPRQNYHNNKMALRSDTLTVMQSELENFKALLK
jgi:enoyl-CoA hydratase